MPARWAGGGAVTQEASAVAAWTSFLGVVRLYASEIFSPVRTCQDPDKPCQDGLSGPEWCPDSPS